MKHRVCPVWVGYLLACPVRTIVHNPRRILGPFVKPGMTVLDVGSAMGFFSLPMARLVGAGGREICVDLQARMLERLTKRAQRAGLAERVETRLCDAAGLRVDDLASRVDFALAFAVVHEVPAAVRLMREIVGALKPDGRLLIAEPRGHVSASAFEETILTAATVGLRTVSTPRIARCHATLLERT